MSEWKAELAIDDNSDTMVMASLDQAQQVALLQAMDKAASMTVTVGKAPPMKISLTGSTKVTNAWRTCAGLKGAQSNPDSNPFK